MSAEPWRAPRYLLLALATILLVACPGRTDQNDREQPLSAEALYDMIPQEDTQRCLPMSRVHRIEPIGNHTLLFHLGQDEVWRNRLQSACPGIGPHSRLLIEPRAGRLCSLDTVHALIDDGFGYRRGSACSLGEFDPLDADEQDALRELR